MQIENIHADAIGVHYDYAGFNEKPVISAQDDTNVGQLNFHIPKICQDECYIQHPDKLSPAIISTNWRLIERDSVTKKMEMFRAMRATFSNINFRVQTNHIKRYDFNGSIELTWPKLVNGPVEFPVLQVGHELIKSIDVHNPSNETIMAYYMIHDVHQYGMSMSLPPEIITDCWNCFLTRDPVFTLVDPNLRGLHFSYIPPKTTAKVAVKFSTPVPGSFATLFYVRNNFTILEAIWLTAKAVMPQFKFGNRKPGSKTPLLFELTDKHLRDCNHPNLNMRSVSAKRTFTAKNSGEVPIMLNSIRIDDLPCEGYGFRVSDCEPFELAPNGSRKIEISFTPDFTLAMVKKTLFIDTSLNYSVNYTLLSMVAPLSLSICSKALARPEWESAVKYVTAIVLAVSFLCVLLVSYLDSIKVLKCHLQNMSKAKGALQPTLDLRQIALKTSLQDEANKSNGSSNSSSSNLTTIAAQNKSVCNGKQNGTTGRRRNADRKRTESSVENNTSPKSWTSELAKKLTPKKTDVRFKDPSPSKAKTILAGEKQSSSKKEKKTKEATQSDGLKFSHIENEDEEVSSTTTENSINSDEKSSQMSSASKKQVLLKEIPMAEIKDKKTIVKKSKSLPLNYQTQKSENISPLSLFSSNFATTPDKDDKDSGDSQPELPKRPTFLKDFSNSALINNRFEPIKPTTGKTPGRERNKTYETGSPIQPADIGPSTMGMNSTYKSSAFQFSSPLSQSPTSGTHPLWDLNKITFSSVVTKSDSTSSSPSGSPPPQKQLSPSPVTVQSKQGGKAQKPANSKNKPAKLQNNSVDKKPFKGKCLIPADTSFSARPSFEILPDEKSNCKQTTVDHGPIGTRKSPSSTPFWEPMNTIHKPKPVNSSTKLLSEPANSNSFFSGAFSQNSGFQRPNALSEFLQQVQTTDSVHNHKHQPHHHSPHDFGLLGGASGLLDNVYGNSLEQQKQQRLWDSALLINLIHQQQQLQKQADHLHRLTTSAPTSSAHSQASLTSTTSCLQPMYNPPHTLWNSTAPFDAQCTRQSDRFWSPATTSTIKTPSEAGKITILQPNRSFQLQQQQKLNQQRLQQLQMQNQAQKKQQQQGPQQPPLLQQQQYQQQQQQQQHPQQ